MKINTALGYVAFACALGLASASASALTVTSTAINTVPTPGTASNTLVGTLSAPSDSTVGYLHLATGLPGEARSPWTTDTAPATGDQDFASVTNGSITYDLKSASTGSGFGPSYPGANKVSLIWGSPDSYNTLQLYKGATLLASIIPGTTAGLSPDGIKSYLVTISDVLFDKLVFRSSTAAFEFTNVKVTAVPLPAAAWLFISAIGGLIAIGRRRQMYGLAA